MCFVERYVHFVERCFCREATEVHFQKAMQRSNKNADCSEITWWRQKRRNVSFFSTWLAKIWHSQATSCCCLNAVDRLESTCKGGGGNQASISNDKCLAVNLLPESIFVYLSHATCRRTFLLFCLHHVISLQSACLLLLCMLCIAL